MSRPPLCLFGKGGHGRVVAAQIRAEGLVPGYWPDLLFADMADPTADFRDLADIRDVEIIVTIGDNAARARIFTAAAERGLPPARFVSARAHVHADAIGAGAMILAGAIVNTGAAIGEGTILNSASVVEHDCTISAFAHVSPGAVMAGGAALGHRSWLGTNATVIPGVSIPDDTIIGAGAVVIDTIATPGTYVGNPARLVKTHESC